MLTKNELLFANSNKKQIKTQQNGIKLKITLLGIRESVYLQRREIMINCRHVILTF